MISIIITAFKEPKTIGKAVESFLNQEIKEEYEILVVAPDKETQDSAKKYKKVKIIQDPGEGKPNALNIAIKKAKGRILILSDGDVFVDKNSVKYMLEPFKDSKVGIVSGRPVPINSKKNKFGYWSHLLTEAGAHKERLERRRKGGFIVCSGYLYAIRSGILNRIPKEALSEDAGVSYFIYSRDYKTVYSPYARVYVKYPTNLKDWILQKKRSAGGYTSTQLKQFKNQPKMRSFFKESSRVFRALAYAKNFKEFIWTIELILIRLYLWFIIFIDIRVKKKPLKKIWLRASSTK